MSRISSIQSLSSGQLSALRRIQELNVAIQQNTTRLATLKRINSSKDDPAGMIQSTLLENQISAAEAASNSVTRANAMLSTADAAMSEITSQLQQARSLALEVAGGTLSSAEIAANQVELDSILRGIDTLSRTEFNGKRLLDGSSGFRAIGVDSSEIVDVDVLDKQTSSDVAIDINVTSLATQATDTYSGGALAADTTLIVEGSRGVTTISLSSGATLDDIADAFNAVSHLTGITAAVDGSDVDLTSSEYGSDAMIEIEATQGTFATTSGGSTTGTDAEATINGVAYTGDGTTFSINTETVAAVIEVDPTASGSLSSFTITGEGLEFTIGTSLTSTVRTGLPALTMSSLGGVSGKLSSLLTGGANSLTSGNTTQALDVIDDAISDVTRAQSLVGSFQRFTLDSASSILSSTITNLSDALSAEQDTDVALETALLQNNQFMLQTASNVLAITSMRNDDVLTLLRTTMARL